MFYVDTLGLTVTERTPFALVVDGGGGTELRVTLVQSKADTGYTVLAGARRICPRPSTSSARRASTSAHQGMDQDDHAAWTAPDGTRVAWFHDPHGNVLSIHQPPS